ncbi:glycosyltransferase [Lithospermum erythrorhizon]|uniref:Glycosyltransferase n=1 Tax=Lithospermum erythrorhizon TaxID=34254 RepID=A0AAV3Q345_LITER
MMSKLLKHVIVLLLFKTDWKKLFFAFSVVTICSLFVQMSTIPYPLSGWVYSPSIEQILSNKMLNMSTHLDQNRRVISEDRLVTSSPELDQSEGTKKKNVRRRKGHKRKKSEEDFASAPQPPPPSFPSHLLRFIRSLTPEAALAYARKEIENAPLVTNDLDLYAPIFRNVSTFKRSYELMELILKVYIYQEGEKPKFHDPVLGGIYASEGWFMKLIEDSKYFTTADPEKAHLFYLPYSAHQLRLALFEPNTANIQRISIFLRDYVNMLSKKYPFWNRTRGRDHFLVACHDWGSYTLVNHEELLMNTIKALCNADASEGIFITEKDVSLPETSIRNPKRPLTNMGGKDASEREILAFFAGNRHGRVRNDLIRLWGDKYDYMRIYARLPLRVSRNMSYPEHMKSSKYCICPMGYEVNSPRIVEAIYHECIPVIIADYFALPLSDVLDWNAFSVVVAEDDVPKLKEILLDIPMEKYITLQNNVKMLQKHFYWNTRPVKYDLFHMILHSIWLKRINQVQIPKS